MAMGAFLAGVLLSTSSFRHQLEADVEPFRGLLLGLFFVAVGMSLDLSVVAGNWQVIALSVVGYMLVKSAAIYGLARLLKSDHAEALERAVLMSQGGEFAFVLYTTAVTAGILTGPTNAIFTATVIISMVLTPFAVLALPFVMPKKAVSLEGVEVVEGRSDSVLVIGFGRFGQIVTQPLLAMKHKLSIIDNDVDMIRAAESFARIKVYYGDGTRLDILHAAGAATADVVLVCIDNKASATRIVELVKSEFPLVKVMARAYDRGHALDLIEAGVDYQLREMFESSLVFGGEVIRELGASDEEIADVLEGVRRRDRARFAAQQAGGIAAGRDLLLSNAEDQAREQGVRAAQAVDPDAPIKEGAQN